MNVNGITNCWAGDVALVDLLTGGRTDAPAGVVAQLADLGHVVHAAGVASLTAAGRARAVALKPSGDTLRRLFINAQTGSALRGVGGPSLTGTPYGRPPRY